MLTNWKNLSRPVHIVLCVTVLRDRNSLLTGKGMVLFSHGLCDLSYKKGHRILSQFVSRNKTKYRKEQMPHRPSASAVCSDAKVPCCRLGCACPH